MSTLTKESYCTNLLESFSLKTHRLWEEMKQELVDEEIQTSAELCTKEARGTEGSD